jgi:CheY-like chemotaxis protein
MEDATAGSTTVLVVDDYADTLDALVLGLQAEGFRVLPARSGAEAIRRAAQSTLDAIVMDLSMPGIDGWEAIREIRSAAHTAHVPIIAMTALPELWNRTKAEAAGCDSFLQKPCGPGELAREIRSVVDAACLRPR